MMENELVKEKDETSELDCVVELGLEEVVDPVLEEDSVFCCAPTPSATKHCSHNFECHIAAWGKEDRHKRNYTQGIHVSRRRHVGVVMHWLLFVRVFDKAQSWPIRSGHCVRHAPGTKANLAAGGLFAGHLGRGVG